MNDYRKAASDKPVLTDEQLFSGLMTISSISKALAKKVLIRATTNSKHQKGGNNYVRGKKTQHSRT